MNLENSFGFKSVNRSLSLRSNWNEPNSKETLTQLESSTPLPKTNNPSFNTFSIVSSAATTTSKEFLNPSRIAIVVVVGLVVIGSVAALGVTSYYYSNRLYITTDADYGDSCLNRKCLESKQLKCIDQVCQCDTSFFYWNSAKSKCQDISFDVRYHGNLCKSGYTQCLNNTQCINSMCQCDSNNYFWNGNTCVSKKTYSTVCNIRQTVSVSPSTDPVNCVSDNECTECLTNSLLVCNASTSTCECPSTNYYYDTYQAKCVQLKSYFVACTNTLECDSSVGLYCQNSTSNRTASCPSSSILNRCDCPNGQYFDYTYFKCLPKKDYMRPCTVSCECDSSKRLQCYGSLCSCSPNTYYNSSTCVSSATISFLGSCKQTPECRTDLGLICTNNSICDCNTPYYWSTTMKMCVECPDGWILIGTTNNVTRCYYLSTVTATWPTAANDRCPNYDADILTIADTFEYQALYSYFTTQTFNRLYFIGVYSNSWTSSWSSYGWYIYNGPYIGSYVNFNSYNIPTLSGTVNGYYYYYIAIYTGNGNFYSQMVYDVNSNYYICKKRLA